jgi:hypothetical protein
MYCERLLVTRDNNNTVIMKYSATWLSVFSHHGSCVLHQVAEKPQNNGWPLNLSRARGIN